MRTPGLFDLQVNGFAGVDFNDASITPEAVDHALEAMRANGVTGCLPTIITASFDVLEERFRALDAAVSASRLGASMVPGYHLEGPFLNDSQGYRGCHPAAAMADPSATPVFQLDSLIERPIILVTLAPERSGAADVVGTLRRAGKTVAVGHSAAGYGDIKAAADAGLTLSTHLGNGLPQTLPKLENTILAQLAESRLSACLIADGHHMSPDALGALVRIKGPEHCILVTDAVLAAGAAPGTYRFAGMEITLTASGAVTKPESPGLAGSSLGLDAAIRNTVEWGIVPPAQAIEMASDNARMAIASSLRHYGISTDAGLVEWNSALVPTIIEA